MSDQSPDAVQEPPKKRQRRKAEYFLQRRVNTSIGTQAWETMEDKSFDDAASAKKHARDAGVEGQYRIIRVVDEFTAKKETKTVTKLS